jgi:hypothetical protein
MLLLMLYLSIGGLPAILFYSMLDFEKHALKNIFLFDHVACA